MFQFACHLHEQLCSTLHHIAPVRLSTDVKTFLCCDISLNQQHHFLVLGIIEDDNSYIF